MRLLGWYESMKIIRPDKYREHQNNNRHFRKCRGGAGLSNEQIKKLKEKYAPEIDHRTKFNRFVSFLKSVRRNQNR